MNVPRALCLASLLIAISAAAGAFIAWRAAQPATNGLNESGSRTEWLSGSSDERFVEVERQLRGLDVAMMEIGHRFGELYFAGREENWEFATYQVGKIETALRLALVRRPKREASARPFLTEDLRAAKKVVERHDAEAFMGVMERLRTACMKCHVAEQVPSFTVEFPQSRPSTIRSTR